MVARRLATLIAVVDFWLHVSARIGQRAPVWIALHRLLSIPLLLRRPERSLSVDGVRVSCRAVSDQLGWLLDGGSVADAADAGGVDLEVVQVHPWAAWWWRRRGRRVVPSFARYRGEVAGVPPARPSKSLRSNLSLARRSGFTVRRGDGSSDWKRAREMAESWARVQFGAGAWMPPEHAWRRLRRLGSLLMIVDGSRDVAMTIVVAGRGGREAWLMSIGVAAGDRSLVRAGALTAAYAAAAEHARALGAEVLDAGRCTSRADDSIAVYKSRWGFRPAPDPTSPVYAVRALTPAGERLLDSRRLVTG